MTNFKKAVFVFLALLGYLSLASAQGFECRTPMNQYGQCVSIYDCRPLLEMLMAQQQRAGQYLRASQCGFDRRGPLVCCPMTNANHRPNTDSNESNELPSTSYGPLTPPECGFSNASHTRVVGGIPAKLGAWPWIAILGYRNSKDPSQAKWLCGGSLISRRHVLTAAHCVYDRSDLFKVRLGDLDLKSDYDGASPIEVPIKRKMVHPGYSSSNYINDVAVLTLAHDVPFSPLLHPVCLPVEDSIRTKNIETSFPFIAGWGSVEYKGPSSNILMELQIPVVNTETCKEAFKRFSNAIIDNRTLCAGYLRGGKDACQGDSGGPLILPCGRTTYCQMGIVSYGYKCAEPGYPGIYTRVTEFLDFIISELRD